MCVHFTHTAHTHAHTPFLSWHLQEIAVSQEEDDKETASAEVNDLKEKIKDIKCDILEVQQKSTRVEAQKTLMSNYSEKLLAAGKETTTSDLLDQKTIGN